jgi:bifunctional DNA-binding transcriptional regulator/antitoxin component of YhaV-PrlF toxin-antitoxin module
MSDPVKQDQRSGRRRGHSRISRKHQVTIPLDAFLGAGFEAGDTVKVEALGPGRVTLTRLDALLDKYRGSMSPGAVTTEDIERLRGEWE